MKRHTKIYLRHFGYAAHEDTFIPCEVCFQRAQDVHHIEPRQRGGSKLKDFIENLMAVCRNCHNKFESKEWSQEQAKKIHLNFMKQHESK